MKVIILTCNTTLKPLYFVADKITKFNAVTGVTEVFCVSDTGESLPWEVKESPMEIVEFLSGTHDHDM